MLRNWKFWIMSFLWLCCNNDVISQTTITQQNGRFRICKGTVTDSDNALNRSDYDHNENSTLTLSVPGAKSITLNFSSFCTEKDNDILRIFNGKDTFAKLIGAWSGNVGPGRVSSSDSQITLHFKSDKSIKCFGWKASVLVQTIKPTPFKFLQASAGLSLPSCKDSVIKLATDIPVPCDSVSLANTSISGPNSPKITKVKALNCSNGMSKLFELTVTNGLTLNGLYKITHQHGYRDYCDSVYFLQSLYNFSISNCPIIVDLKSNRDTICKGDCIQLTLKATGGDSTKYKYTWTPAGLSGKGPFTQCLTANRKYTIKVDDGTSVPGYDTVEVVVLDPPKAQADTSVCYYNPNFQLRATPAGGTWKGSGIINSKTGEFKPNSVWGTVKVWYQIGNCADTVNVTVTAPYNYENVFCPSKGSFPLYWYGPAGGTWTGPKTTTNGLFTPDTAGTYILTYTWKGCTSKKTVFVQSIQVPQFDTVCESSTNATLTFSPKGLYPNWFPGLVNYYYGTYNPSLMGGPKNYNIIYAAQGGCRDTTLLTVLPSDAGLNDTFCPTAGKQTLKSFRPNANYSWSGKGINGIGNQYSPDWWNAAMKSNIDTLILKTPKCTDRKLVYILPVQITQPDTLKFCLEDTFTTFLAKGVRVSVPGGVWTGHAAVKKNGFDPRISGPGMFKIRYANKGCDDTLIVWVKSKPIIQLDTSICLNIKYLNLYKKDKNGIFWGPGITQSTGVFNTFSAGPGMHTVFYKSAEGCMNSTKIQVDTVVKILFNHAQWYCFKDSQFTLKATPRNGAWSGKGVIDSSFNPTVAGEGRNYIYYQVQQGACLSKDSQSMVVNTPLTVNLSPKSDSVCYGKILTFEATAFGGLTNKHTLNWSHGQTGSKTFFIAIQSGRLICSVSDGCSENAHDTAFIHVHPRVWTITTLSDTVCRGLKGWALLKLGNGNPTKRTWAHDPGYTSDTLHAYADNLYRVNIRDEITGCQADTTIEIPGYKAIQAGFSIQKQSQGDCLSPLDETALFFNQSSGGTKGQWFWGDGTQTLFSPNINPTHQYNGLLPNYKVMLAIQNDGGCADTMTKDLCYHDTVILYLPTAFTPNGDGMNDAFQPDIYGSSEYRLLIINRWGEIVYESNDKKILWDGTKNNQNCPEGVYAVILEYKSLRQSKRFARSSLTLMRPKSP
ncbi:MAG: hypothetical protein RJA00_197 [Bacteroidota bacterium]